MTTRVEDANTIIFENTSGDNPFSTGFVGLQKEMKDQTRLLNDYLKSQDQSPAGFGTNMRGNSSRYDRNDGRRGSRDMSSMVSQMGREVQRVRIDNVLSDLILPLSERIEILNDIDATRRERYDQEHFLYYERILTAINRANEEGEETSRGIWVTLQQINRHPFWSIGKAIVGAFKGLQGAIKGLYNVVNMGWKALFGVGDQRTELQKIHDVLQKTLQFHRTGEAQGRRRGLIGTIREQGLLGGAAGLVTRGIAQRREDARSRGERVRGWGSGIDQSQREFITQRGRQDPIQNQRNEMMEIQNELLESIDRATTEMAAILRATFGVPQPIPMKVVDGERVDSKVVKAIEKPFTPFLEQMSQFFEDIKTKFSDVKEKVTTSTSGIFQSTKQDIKTEFSDVKEKVTEVVNSSKKTESSTSGIFQSTKQDVEEAQVHRDRQLEILEDNKDVKEKVTEVVNSSKKTTTSTSGIFQLTKQDVEEAQVHRDQQLEVLEDVEKSTSQSAREAARARRMRMLHFVTSGIMGIANTVTNIASSILDMVGSLGKIVASLGVIEGFRRYLSRIPRPTTVPSRTPKPSRTPRGALLPRLGKFLKGTGIAGIVIGGLSPTTMGTPESVPEEQRYDEEVSQYARREKSRREFTSSFGGSVLGGGQSNVDSLIASGDRTELDNPMFDWSAFDRTEVGEVGEAAKAFDRAEAVERSVEQLNIPQIGLDSVSQELLEGLQQGTFSMDEESKETFKSIREILKDIRDSNKMNLSSEHIDMLQQFHLLGE